jgi:hypothetical protein
MPRDTIGPDATKLLAEGCDDAPVIGLDAMPVDSELEPESGRICTAPA